MLIFDASLFCNSHYEMFWELQLHFCYHIVILIIIEKGELDNLVLMLQTIHTMDTGRKLVNLLVLNFLW